MLLALDLTHTHGSIALLQEGRLLEQKSLSAPDGYSQLIFGELNALLARHHLTWPDIAAFASANGPGSFTGVRVGLTVIKGLAEATGKPAFGISNLHALQSLATTPCAAAFYDARRGDIFARNPDGSEHVLRFADWLPTLPSQTELITFDFTGFPAPHHPTTIASRDLAAPIAHIAWTLYQSGLRPDPATLDANYVRHSDAELAWKAD